QCRTPEPSGWGYHARQLPYFQPTTSTGPGLTSITGDSHQAWVPPEPGLGVGARVQTPAPRPRPAAPAGTLWVGPVALMGGLFPKKARAGREELGAGSRIPPVRVGGSGGKWGRLEPHVPGRVSTRSGR